MNLREIIVDSIKYPISDYRKFLIFCALIILMSLSIVLPSYGVKNGTLAIILSLVTLIVLFVVAGYLVGIIKSGIESEDTLPDFDYAKNFVIGVKAIILDIIYFIIPLILAIIVASATGLFTSFTEIVRIGIDSVANETTNMTTIIAAVPKSTMNTFTNSLSITLIVAIISFIIFSLLAFTAIRKRNRRYKIQRNTKRHEKNWFFKDYNYIDCNLYNCIGFGICNLTDWIDSIYWCFHRYLCRITVYTIVFIQSYRFIVCRCILNHFSFYSYYSTNHLDVLFF